MIRSHFLAMGKKIHIFGTEARPSPVIALLPQPVRLSDTRGGAQCASTHSFLRCTGLLPSLRGLPGPLFSTGGDSPSPPGDTDSWPEDDLGESSAGCLAAAGWCTGVPSRRPSSSALTSPSGSPSEVAAALPERSGVVTLTSSSPSATPPLLSATGGEARGGGGQAAEGLSLLPSSVALSSLPSIATSAPAKRPTEGLCDTAGQRSGCSSLFPQPKKWHLPAQKNLPQAKMHRHSKAWTNATIKCRSEIL